MKLYENEFKILKLKLVCSYILCYRGQRGNKNAVKTAVYFLIYIYFGIIYLFLIKNCENILKAFLELMLLNMPSIDTSGY